MPNGLGDKIKQLRTSKGLTLEELGNLSGSSKSYIWELENRTPPRPSAEKLTKVANTLEVTLDYLLGNEVNVEDAQDKMFYREFQKLDPKAKEKIRSMVNWWKEDND
tara:strand:- start:1986 stop:2306 length:321 start_codon:yes stop_codon:yes gene_type:complete